MSYQLGFVGSGNMAEAIARGVLRAGVYQPDQIIAADPSEARRALFQTQLRAHITASNRDAAKARIIILSVKPQQMRAALDELAPGIDPAALIISIAAGVSSAFIEKQLGEQKQLHVIRTMPNTPMLLGEGMVAMAPGRHATEADMAAARRIFESAAAVVDVPEDKIDAVTAVSGSGPAYFFFLVEQMIRAGVELGLTPQQAHLLATRTATGAAKMLVSTPDSPEELRRKVTSPGGTTQAAIETMQSRGVPDAIVAALHRAAQRSKELGQQY